jgi:hypothetical protein
LPVVVSVLLQLAQQVQSQNTQAVSAWKSITLFEGDVTNVE